jgi:hypothetical protein
MTCSHCRDAADHVTRNPSRPALPALLGLLAQPRCSTAPRQSLAVAGLSLTNEPSHEAQP